MTENRDIPNEATADPRDGGRLGLIVAMMRWALVVIAMVSAVAVVVQIVVGDPVTEEDLEAFVSRFGVAAPIAFILVSALLGSLVVPSTVVMVAGATLFGRAGGFTYSLVAIELAALLGFLVARTLGRARVARWLDRRRRGVVRKLERRLVAKSFSTALYMRLLYIPNGLINVVCGVSGMRVLPFGLATLIATIPLVFAVTFMASGAKEALLSGDWSALYQTETLLALALFIACVSLPVVSGAVSRRLRTRRLVVTPFNELDEVFVADDATVAESDRPD